jgi:alpha-beta hydrolase superfamily lysophospholipase
MVAVAQLLSKLAPSFPTKRIGLGMLSHDESVKPDYLNDPLNFVGRIPLLTATEILGSGLRVIQRAHSCTLPLYVFGGSHDRIALPVGFRRFYAAAGSSDKTLRVHQGMYHETLNEEGRETVVSELLTWMRQRSRRNRSERTGLVD